MTLFDRTEEEISDLLREAERLGFTEYDYDSFRTKYVVRQIDHSKAAFRHYPVKDMTNVTLNVPRTESIIANYAKIFNPFIYESALAAKDNVNNHFGDDHTEYFDVFKLELDLVSNGAEYRVKNMSGDVVSYSPFIESGDKVKNEN